MGFFSCSIFFFLKKNKHPQALRLFKMFILSTVHFHFNIFREIL